MAKSPGLPRRGCLSPDGILREIQINLLECKVCFETFGCQQRERRPQNLSCGHVLCLECVSALTHPLLRKLECPFCRQLCSVDGTSHCQVLSDLQELLLSQSPPSSAPSRGTRGSLLSSTGPTREALHLQAAFGGWGTLVNPTGIAVLGSKRMIVVVHDGEKRVVVFNLQGRRLHSFGRKGTDTGDVCYPVDVAVTTSGYVVVTDAGDKAVKVYTSRGTHLLTVGKSFKLPWGVDTDTCGHILVSDVQAGTLSQVKVDFRRGALLEHQTVISDLQCPKSVACCHGNGNVAVMEHPTTTENHQYRQLRVFTQDFRLLHRVDSFGLTLLSAARLNMSGVAFDDHGDVVVTDSDQGMIFSLGKLKNDGPVLTPLVGHHLIRPVGLVLRSNTLIALDGGDHTVKIYSTDSISHVDKPQTERGGDEQNAN